jgi:hypothetical protein
MCATSPVHQSNEIKLVKNEHTRLSVENICLRGRHTLRRQPTLRKKCPCVFNEISGVAILGVTGC